MAKPSTSGNLDAFQITIRTHRRVTITQPNRNVRFSCRNVWFVLLMVLMVVLIGLIVMQWHGVNSTVQPTTQPTVAVQTVTVTPTSQPTVTVTPTAKPTEIPTTATNTQTTSDIWNPFPYGNSTHSTINTTEITTIATDNWNPLDPHVNSTIPTTIQPTMPTITVPTAGVTTRTTANDIWNPLNPQP